MRSNVMKKPLLLLFLLSSIAISFLLIQSIESENSGALNVASADPLCSSFFFGLEFYEEISASNDFIHCNADPQAYIKSKRLSTNTINLHPRVNILNFPNSIPLTIENSIVATEQNEPEESLVNYTIKLADSHIFLDSGADESMMLLDDVRVNGTEYLKLTDRPITIVNRFLTGLGGTVLLVGTPRVFSHLGLEFDSIAVFPAQMKQNNFFMADTEQVIGYIGLDVLFTMGSACLDVENSTLARECSDKPDTPTLKLPLYYHSGLLYIEVETSDSTYMALVDTGSGINFKFSENCSPANVYPIAAFGSQTIFEGEVWMDKFIFGDRIFEDVGILCIHRPNREHGYLIIGAGFLLQFKKIYFDFKEGYLYLY